MNKRREISWIRRVFKKDALGLKKVKVTDTGIGYHIEGLSKMRGIWVPLEIRDKFYAYAFHPRVEIKDIAINLERIKK